MAFLREGGGRLAPVHQVTLGAISGLGDVGAHAFVGYR